MANIKKAGFDGTTEHYSGKSLEAIDVIDDFELNFSLGNAVKYILRAGKKGTKADALQDLKKAGAYIAHEIEKRGAEAEDHEPDARAARLFAEIEASILKARVGDAASEQARELMGAYLMLCELKKIVIG